MYECFKYTNDIGRTTSMFSVSSRAFKYQQGICQVCSEYMAACKPNTKDNTVKILMGKLLTS